MAPLSTLVRCLALVCCLSQFGCSGSDAPEGDPSGDAGDSRVDAQGPSGAADAGSATPDAHAARQDAGGEAPGDVCERSFPTVSLCSPLDPSSCDSAPGDAACKLVITFMDGEPEMSLSCNVPNEGSGEAGATCQGSRDDCVAGLECLKWDLAAPEPRSAVCSKLCELETGRGCEDDEFCTGWLPEPPASVAGFGACTTRCDPYDADACPAGQACTADFNYPEQTCLPEFRCLRVEGGGRAEGEACTSGSATRMCERGLVCLDQSCVKPCRVDADCGQGTCGAPATDFALRFCQ